MSTTANPTAEASPGAAKKGVNLAGLQRTRTQPLAGMGAQTPTAKVDVIGNLPYYITSDILLHLLDQYDRIERIVIMVQKEVADRIAAKPGTREYGLLSATAQLHGRVEKLFVVAPGAFQPRSAPWRQNRPSGARVFSVRPPGPSRRFRRRAPGLVARARTTALRTAQPI